MIVAPTRDPGFALHPAHGELAQHRFLRAVLPHIPRFGTAVDVGAHIGLWARALAIKFKYVVAFEPVAENFACLEQNAAFRNVQRENVALGSADGTCSMVLPPKGNSGCWFAQPVQGPTKLATLDSYKFNNVDLIKIDVEGLEGSVLAGAEQTIKRCLPTIVFEDNGLGVKHYGAQWLDPKQLLSGWRYKCIAAHEKNFIWIPC